MKRKVVMKDVGAHHGVGEIGCDKGRRAVTQSMAEVGWDCASVWAFARACVRNCAQKYVCVYRCGEARGANRCTDCWPLLRTLQVNEQGRIVGNGRRQYDIASNQCEGGEKLSSSVTWCQNGVEQCRRLSVSF